jgi:hypothetical protein
MYPAVSLGYLAHHGKAESGKRSRSGRKEAAGKQ